MGKKIPGRKHHGVRDPERQREQRLLKEKADAPPTHPDDQPVPKSVLRIAELMKKVDTPLIHKPKNKRNKKLIVVKTKVGKGEKPVPKFEQRKGESDNAFMYRVNNIVENVKREAAFEKKFGVEVKRNPETGKIEGLMKREKDPLEKMLKTIRKEHKEQKKKTSKKKQQEKENKESLTKSQKRSLKLKAKKEKKKAKDSDESQKGKDHVKFGEVVHAPPTFGNSTEVARPGRKELILSSLIGPKKAHKKSAVKIKVIDKSGKRKNLPPVLRLQLDKQQKEAIEAYKAIKAKKMIEH